MHPAVSVVIPVFDTEQYLAECLASVLNQTFTDIEVIVVSDGSPGDTAKVVDEVANGDPRVRVILQHPNVGLMDARSIGVAQASGEFLAFVDSDDMLEEWFIDRLHTAAIAHDVDLVQCAFTLPDTGESINRGGDAHVVEGTDAIVSEFLLGKMSLAVWNKLYRTSTWRSAVEPLTLHTRFAEDMLCVFEVAQHCQRYAHITDAGYRYLPRSTGMTLSTDAARIEWKLGCLDDVYRHIQGVLSTRDDPDEAVNSFFQRELLFVVRDLLHQYADATSSVVPGLPASPPGLGLMAAAARGFLELDGSRQADYFQREVDVARQDLLDEVAKRDTVIAVLKVEIDRLESSALRMIDDLHWHAARLAELEQEREALRIHHVSELERRDRNLAEHAVQLQEQQRARDEASSLFRRRRSS